MLDEVRHRIPIHGVSRLIALAAVAVAAAAGPPSTAIAAASPLVATDGVVPSGPTSARVDGSADPEGSETVLRADYAPASAQWCVSGGADGAPLETVGEALGAGDVMYSEVSVGLEGLSPGVEYCAELVASSEAGTSRGGQRRFTTPHQATPPTADGGDPGALPEVTPLAPSGTPPSFGVAATVPSQARSPVAVARPAKAAGLARAPRACRHRPRKRRASCERRLRRRRAARGKRAGHTG
jgi:hypothetical protein